MWVLDYEDDIASDLAVFHRVDDPMTLDGPRYFMLAVRLAAYAGVLAARAEKIRHDEREGVSGAHGGAQQRSTTDRPARVTDDALIASLGDGWVEHVTEEGEVE